MKIHFKSIINNQKYLRFVFSLTILIYSVSMIWIAVCGGVQHDYTGYLKQWNLVLSTSNPWSTDNAYGPLHNLLAYATYLGLLGPKLIMVSILMIANALLIIEIWNTRKNVNDYLIYFFAVPSNVLIISMAFTYGLNDTLVAAFIVFAIIFRSRHQMVLAGVFLGFAILLKYYPIFLVPLFALQKRHFNLRLIMSVVAVIAIGFLIALALWDTTLLTAFSLGANRGPKLLSILAALRNHPNLVGGPEIVSFLIDKNVYFLIVVEIFIVFFSWKIRLNWLEASVLGLLIVLLTYKVGHQQFFIPWIFMVASLPLVNNESARRLALCCLPFVFFLSIFQWGYAYGSDGYNNVLGGVRRNVGFVSFSLGLLILISYFKWWFLTYPFKTTPVVKLD